MKIISLHQKQVLLIEKLKQNNTEAQELLFNQFAPKMLGICRQYISDRHLAEEQMLSGFLKVFTKLDSYKFKGSFEGWIRRIMINECLSFLRKKNPLIFTDDISILETTLSNNYDENDVSDLQILIDKLPTAWRIVFNLFAIEGYKHKEIAKKLCITEMTSRSRYFKAKKQLQKTYLESKTKAHGKGY